MMNKTKDRYIPEITDLIDAKANRVYLDTQNPRVCVKGQEDFDAENLGYPDLPENDYFLFYELRSAADKLKSPDDFNDVVAENMRKKIAAQLDTLIENNIRHVVLSAFGCGAFNNPADKVASIYKEELQKRAGKFDDVVFAVFHAGYGPNNFQPFYDCLNGLSLGQKPASRPSSAGMFGDAVTAVKNTGSSTSTAKEDPDKKLGA